jgi:hypothetical protein
MAEKAETCRITMCLYIILSNHIGIVGIYMVTGLCIYLMTLLVILIERQIILSQLMMN